MTQSSASGRGPLVSAVLLALALLGAAAFLSFWGMLLVVRLADTEPADALFWAWAVVGLFGLAAALVFGTLTLLALSAGGRTGSPLRTGIAVLAVLCIVAALFFVGQPATAVPALLLVAVAGVALYRLMRQRR